MNTDRDEQLRQRAYRIWESEGRPEGMQSQHWARAERELAEEDGGWVAALPTAARSRRKPSAAAGAIAPAAGAQVKEKAAPAASKAAPRRKKD
jgi:hypothetical protein